MSEIEEYLKKHYSEDVISEMIDEEIDGWVDEDDLVYVVHWENDKHGYYMEYFNGEAEDAVRANIKQDIINKFPATNYPKSLDDLIREHDERLDV